VGEITISAEAMGDGSGEGVILSSPELEIYENLITAVKATRW
jgi:hypothetical protein